MCSPVTPMNFCLHVFYCAFLLSCLCTSFFFYPFLNMFRFMNAFMWSINTKHIFFLLLWFKETENMGGIFIRKLQKTISGLVLWQQKCQSPTFLGQLEGLGIRTTKMLYFIVWQFFIASDTGTVLCMLSLRLTSVRYFWVVFKPCNDEVRHPLTPSSFDWYVTWKIVSLYMFMLIVNV